MEVVTEQSGDDSDAGGGSWNAFPSPTTIMANQPTPPNVPPPNNKAENETLISGGGVRYGWGRLTSH